MAPWGAGMPSAKHTVKQSIRAAERGAPPRRKPAARGKTAAPPPQTQPPAFDLTTVLAQASWRDADEALAKALRDFSALEKAAQAASRKAPPPQAQQVEDALWAVSQSLRAAGRRRNLHRFGDVGAVEQFDPQRHALLKPGKRAPSKVRITSPGVMRGAGDDAEIVLMALVSPVRARKAPSRKTS